MLLVPAKVDFIMELSTLESSQSVNENNINNISVNSDDASEVFNTDFEEHNESFDINSSDFECSDEGQDEHSNNLNNCMEQLKNNDENVCLTATIQSENHCNDKHTDFDNQHKELIGTSQKPVDNCVYDYAQEEEPIFDFLGKANEIVCY